MKNGNGTLRPEYFYAKLWTKGMSMNCFRIRHSDIDKELNYPDNPKAESTFHIKKYFYKTLLFLYISIYKVIYIINLYFLNNNTKFI